VAALRHPTLDFAHIYAQVIIVTRATYGEVDSGDASKLIDVTNDVQGLVQGRTLLIERDLDLNAFFRWDPSPGHWTVTERVL